MADEIYTVTDFISVWTKWKKRDWTWTDFPSLAIGNSYRSREKIRHCQTQGGTDTDASDGAPNGRDTRLPGRDEPGRSTAARRTHPPTRSTTNTPEHAGTREHDTTRALQHTSARKHTASGLSSAAAQGKETLRASSL